MSALGGWRGLSTRLVSASVMWLSACDVAPPAADTPAKQARAAPETTQSVMGEGARGQDGEGSITDYLTINPQAKWPTQTIGVCWENFDDSTQADRALVETAVRRTWEAHSDIRFGNRTGAPWIECRTNSSGVRIGVADAGPRVLQLGNGINGRPNGMLLNFTFANWDPACPPGRDLCIASIAVHEFGHVLGFHHEQNRVDAPGECRKLAAGSNPVRELTPYDPDSVMNYCNVRPNNNGELSAGDIIGLQAAYPN